MTKPREVRPPPRPPSGAPSESRTAPRQPLGEESGLPCYLQRWDVVHRIWRFVTMKAQGRTRDSVCSWAIAAGGAAGYYRWAWVCGWSNVAGVHWKADIDLGKSTPPVWCGAIA